MTSMYKAMGMSTNGRLRSPIDRNLQRRRKSVRWPVSSCPKQKKWWLPRNRHLNPYGQRMFHINCKKIDQREGQTFILPTEVKNKKERPNIILFLRLMNSHERWCYLSHLCMIKLSLCICELINEKNSACRHLFIGWTTLKTFVCYLLL